MSLARRGVVVTRPGALAAGLADRIEAAGGRAIRFPAIETEDLPLPDALQRAASYDLVIFVSPTAVDKATRDGRRWPRAAAVGAGTRQALEARGIAPVIAPQGEADSEALLALPELRQVAGQRVLIVRGQGGRALLGESLAARGAWVDYAECYRRTRPRADPTALLAPHCSARRARRGCAPLRFSFPTRGSPPKPSAWACGRSSLPARPTTRCCGGWWHTSRHE